MALFGCRIDDHHLQRASFFETDMVIWKSFFKPDTFSGSERVIVAHQHTNPVSPERDKVKAFGRHNRCNQAKINDAVAHHMNRYLADLLMKLDLDVWVAGYKSLQHFR